MCACVCVCVCLCISPRSMCIWKGGVNLSRSYRSLMCANVFVFVISNTHTQIHTHMMTVLHIFSVEGHKCGFDRICTCMFRSICSQVLHLMDRFNVSDKFYHELPMVQPTIPRSHRITHVRSELNQSLKTNMYRVPRPNHGVYCSLTERLCEELEVILSTATHDVPNSIRFS